MPIIHFNMLDTRTVEQKRRLCAAVTATVSEVLSVRPEQVRIIIHDLAPENFAVAGVTAGEKGEKYEGAQQEAPRTNGDAR
jgi:4-oxalocrotonate tautomerase